MSTQQPEPLRQPLSDDLVPDEERPVGASTEDPETRPGRQEGDRGSDHEGDRGSDHEGDRGSDESDHVERGDGGQPLRAEDPQQ